MLAAPRKVFCTIIYSNGVGGDLKGWELIGQTFEI